MVCGPWPDYYIIVALGPCNERGRPEQCQLRGGTGKRCQKYAVAPSNASSGATELAYGKYWRRELPGLEPVRQWKTTELAYGKYWRRELPGLKPVRQWKIERTTGHCLTTTIGTCQLYLAVPTVQHTGLNTESTNGILRGTL
mgnify:CR=1 FL=1